MLENKFYKVTKNSGGTFVTAVFFNPVTKEHDTEVLRDYDYSDCSRDNDDLYYMEVNEEARKEWLRFNGIISIGDTVKVVKGRKIPIGYTGKVIKMFDYKDKYGRFLTEYIVFEDGQKTNVDNCILI